MKNEVLEKIRLFLIDIDGVIVKGDTPIEGVAEGIGILRRNGARTLFLTNNSTRSRRTLIQWFKDAGIDTAAEDMFPSSYLAAQYVFNSGLKTVYIIGEKGLLEEFTKAGLKIVTENVEDCDAVVVGLDRDFNYSKLTKGFSLIRNGARFIAANTDATLPLEKGEIPGAGAMVGSLKGCTGKRPILLGKPNTFLVKLALDMTGNKVSECAIVGDRPDTDMAMARKGGCVGIIVLTGVANKKYCKDYPADQRPDLIYPSLLELTKDYENARKNNQNNIQTNVHPKN